MSKHKRDYYYFNNDISLNDVCRIMTILIIKMG
jgi:hypothetical protein